jgi:hypothetical protein
MEPVDEMIEVLILSGAIEIAALDSNTGEPLYSFGPKIKEIMPELYEKHLTEVNRDIMRLWESGFLEVDLLEENPMVTLTTKSFDDNELKNMNAQDHLALNEIKRLLAK